jgi:formylmethanofuran dehydrogenase subunit A
MKKQKEKKPTGLTRRQFLFSSTVGVGCLAVGLKEALAQARATGKPVFTEAALNKLIAGATPEEAKAMAEMAKADLLAFANKYFTLTPLQVKWIKTMTPKEKAAILEAINRYQKTSEKFHVKFIQPAGDKMKVKKTLEVEW